MAESAVRMKCIVRMRRLRCMARKVGGGWSQSSSSSVQPAALLLLRGGHRLLQDVGMPCSLLPGPLPCPTGHRGRRRIPVRGASTSSVLLLLQPAPHAIPSLPPPTPSPPFPHAHEDSPVPFPFATLRGEEGLRSACMPAARNLGQDSDLSPPERPVQVGARAWRC